jgi:hypothetical protein
VVIAPSILCSPLQIDRFLNCRTVAASVELSILGALLSKWHPVVHKSRVSLSYS